MRASIAPLRVGVIGGGHMGFNHARVFAEMESVELVGVAELDPAIRARIARRLRVPVYEHHRDLLRRGDPQVVSVVVPTTQHYEVTSDAIDAGCHVLVEKPIASSCEEGASLIGRAAARGVLLSVGHIERFNPAVRELKLRLQRGELGQIYQVHARRLGPFPQRVYDVGVVIDLATHDVDVMRFLLGCEVTRLFAETARRLHADHEDMLSGVVKFANGTVGVLDVNWLTPTKIRELSVTGERGMFVVDYLKQDLVWYQNDWTQQIWHAGDERHTISEGDVIKLKVDRQESLAVELSAFLAAARGEEPLQVTGQDGLEALRIAEALVASGRSHREMAMTTAALTHGV
jgi:UDP-N-acetylglucosamine 3-dehydrogenase